MEMLSSLLFLLKRRLNIYREIYNISLNIYICMHDLRILELAGDPVGLKRFYTSKELTKKQTRHLIETSVYLSKCVAKCVATPVGKRASVLNWCFTVHVNIFKQQRLI